MRSHEQVMMQRDLLLRLSAVACYGFLDWNRRLSIISRYQHSYQKSKTLSENSLVVTTLVVKERLESRLHAFFG